MTNPETVVVRDCDCKYLIRWLLSFDTEVAYITNDEGARAAKKGSAPCAMVGFPLADVFRLPSAGALDEDRIDAKLLTPRFP